MRVSEIVIDIKLILPVSTQRTLSTDYDLSFPGSCSENNANSVFSTVGIQADHWKLIILSLILLIFFTCIFISNLERKNWKGKNNWRNDKIGWSHHRHESPSVWLMFFFLFTPTKLIFQKKLKDQRFFHYGKFIRP